jgi:hypothetical protein
MKEVNILCVFYENCMDNINAGPVQQGLFANDYRSKNI